VDWSALQEVCAAVWLAYPGRSVTDKVVAVILPVSAFVAAGFEHCVANMYFLPPGWLLVETGHFPAGFDALFNCRLAIVATRNRLGMQQATGWHPGTCHE
jgi:formate/nitrite transporter FocA (FNT family)